MEYRNLGNSGLKVSVVGLGCNNFGARVDAAGAQAVVNQCIEEGITLFDTADMYGGGESEKFLGAALKPHRRDVVIATKAGASMGEGPYKRGASRRYLMDAVDASLRARRAREGAACRRHTGSRVARGRGLAHLLPLGPADTTAPYPPGFRIGASRGLRSQRWHRSRLPPNL